MAILVLASASPRRRALLGGLGLAFDVVAPQVPEVRRPGEAPAPFARRLAAEKAADVARRVSPDAWVLAADTIVVIGEEILGKPADPPEAVAMLRALSGRAHRVVTGLALRSERGVQQLAVSTRVRFRPLTEREIAWYVATGEPFDAAGAYKIQERGGVLVATVEGSHSNVIGLPLAETLGMLQAAGLSLPWDGGDT